MIYTFTSTELGACRLQRITSGRRGFSAPKLFILSTVDQRKTKRRTYRFVDKVIAGIDPAQLSDATLSRIAVAQFLACVINCENALIETLDINIAPFTGIVLNEAGGEMRHAVIPEIYKRQPHHVRTNQNIAGEPVSPVR